MKKNMLVFAAMGMELVGIIVASVFLGQYLDEKYQWKGMGVLALSILSLVGWLVHIILLLRQMDRASDE